MRYLIAAAVIYTAAVGCNTTVPPTVAPCPPARCIVR